LVECKKCGGAIPYGSFGNVKCEYCSAVNYVPLPQEGQAEVRVSAPTPKVEKEEPKVKRPSKRPGRGAGGWLKIFIILTVLGVSVVVVFAIYSSMVSSAGVKLDKSVSSYTTSAPVKTSPPKTTTGPSLSELQEKCMLAKEGTSYKNAIGGIEAYAKVPKSEKCEVFKEGGASFRKTSYGTRCLATTRGNVFWVNYVNWNNINTGDIHTRLVCFIGECSVADSPQSLDVLIEGGFQEVPSMGMTYLSETCD